MCGGLRFLRMKQATALPPAACLIYGLQHHHDVCFGEGLDTTLLACSLEQFVLLMRLLQRVNRNKACDVSRSAIMDSAGPDLRH